MKMNLAARGLKRLQKEARTNGQSVKETASNVIFYEIQEDDQLLQEAVEFSRRLYGAPATAEAYANEDGTELYTSFSDGGDGFEGLYRRTLTLLNNYEEEQMYLSAEEAKKLRPISMKEYERLEQKLFEDFIANLNEDFRKRFGEDFLAG